MKIRIISMAVFLASVMTCRDPGLLQVSILATDMAFEPKELHFRSGQKIELELRNKGQVLHDWNVTGMIDTNHIHHHNQVKSELPLGHQHPVRDNQVHAMAEAGQKGVIRFQAGPTGVYEFFCSVPGHREAGMKGQIMVH